LNGEWKESSEHVVRLPADKSELFKIYYKWLYFGDLFVKLEGDAKIEGGGTNRGQDLTAASQTLHISRQASGLAVSTRCYGRAH